MTDIKWAEPPLPARGRGSVPPYGLEALEELRHYPGRWGLLHVFENKGRASSSAQALRVGIRKDIEPGEFEAVTRTQADGYALYARYVGGEK